MVFKAEPTSSFWWVNHKQTVKVEVNEGYIWSPQRNNNGSINRSYDNLTRTASGHTIFSYAGGKIAAIGKVSSPSVEQERPAEFGAAGDQWNKTGWLVKVQWQKLLVPLVPKSHLSEIVPLLPRKYSPIQANGNGNQGVYLAEISNRLGNILLSLIELNNNGISEIIKDIDIALVENSEEKRIQLSPIPNTEKQQLIRARVGQGDFRINVQKIESKCRITGLDDSSLLIASHIKPWRFSSDIERLDGHNGFLLSPHIDKLFDKGLISFSDEGTILFDKNKLFDILKIWSINSEISVGPFTTKQKEYLEYHRTNVFNK